MPVNFFDPAFVAFERAFRDGDGLAYDEAFGHGDVEGFVGQATESRFGLTNCAKFQVMHY